MFTERLTSCEGRQSLTLVSEAGAKADRLPSSRVSLYRMSEVGHTFVESGDLGLCDTLWCLVVVLVVEKVVEHFF